MGKGIVYGIILGTLIVLKFLGVGVVKEQKDFKKSIEGQWYFRKGDSSEWKKERYNHTKWKKIKVPANWESEGNEGYDGIAWYRKEIFIPEKWKKSGGIILSPGKIDDDDITYFNGTEIGRTEGWNNQRIYSVPLSIIKFGEKNIIAIRVKDGGGGGGMYGGELEVRTGFSETFKIDEY